jgi:predicted metal-binding protein
MMTTKRKKDMVVEERPVQGCMAGFRHLSTTRPPPPPYVPGAAAN